MYWSIVGIVSCVKVLLIPAYRSTDFEVHRNWLAITYSLPISKWYHESTSEWTLDYPPLFAWFEFFLSHIAKFVDENMLLVENLNYKSSETVMFQRFSVVLTDLVFAYGVKVCCTYLSTSGVRKSSKWALKWRSPKTTLQILLFGNVGLIMIDHIHFQYNGFLFGILMLSISELFQTRYIRSAILFSILINMKHIFIYIAPVYFVYFLRNYCFLDSTPGLCVRWGSFSRNRFLRLSSAVCSVFLVSIGPFCLVGSLGQMLRRLFPFNRGLCHSYWAPNFWALYNVADKVATLALKGIGQPIVDNSTMTKGLVQDIQHVVLPKISPTITFLLTFIAIIPCLVKLWKWPGNPLHFIRSLVICSLSSFVFGWHVHEKAILIPIIPLTMVAVIWQKEAQIFLILSITGFFSLHPLLFKSFEIPTKYCLLFLHCIYSISNLSYLFDERKSSFKLPLLNKMESTYILGFIGLFLLDVCVNHYLLLFEKYPFLNLLLTSSYCAVGIFYVWLKYYWHFLTMVETSKRKAH